MAVAGMDSKANSLRPFTLELPVSELPDAIASRLPKRLAAATVVAVTIEATQNETEKLESLRRDLQQGIEILMQAVRATPRRCLHGSRSGLASAEVCRACASRNEPSLICSRSPTLSVPITPKLRAALSRCRRITVGCWKRTRLPSVRATDVLPGLRSLPHRRYVISTV